MSSGEVVGSIFFSRDKLFWVEELSVGSGSDFIYDGWFKIKEYTSWDVFSGSGFTEESVKGIITTSDGFVRWHLSVRLDSVFKTIEFPTGVTNLDTTLSYVNTNYFSHCKTVLSY